MIFEVANLTNILQGTETPSNAWICFIVTETFGISGVARNFGWG